MRLAGGSAGERASPFSGRHGSRLHRVRAAPLARDDRRRRHGAHAGGSTEGSGYGILGMQERVGTLGGELEAGRRPGGGFRVHASLPYLRRP